MKKSVRIRPDHRLNLYRFLSIRLADDDLYPHYSYGEKFSPAEVREFWKRTVRMMEEKRAPGKLGLYIHIPFCRQKCLFCFCDSYVPSSYRTVSRYLSLLKKEMDFFSGILRPVSFTSVYFGGGSPSFLRTADLDGLYGAIRRNFRVRPDAQIIFEGTPQDLSREKLSWAARSGVNRLTIGVQSLDPRVIRLMGRPQDKKTFLRVFAEARRKGIPNINVDLIAGLEGQSVRSFLSDLNTVLDAGADMVHVTGFTPLAHTPFCRLGRTLSDAQKKARAVMLEKARKILRSRFRDIGAENAGSSEQAENVQETDLRKENSSLLGIGYSAQSHAFGQVWYQHPHIVTMGKKPDYRALPAFEGVRGSMDEEMRKFVFSNLQRGFSRRVFYSLFGKDALAVFKKEIRELSRTGKLEVEGDRIASVIRGRQDFLVYSKFFYSPARIRAVLRVHRRLYQRGRDYKKELDLLYARKDGK